jgi:FMN phosphatase YigB (HAD superfamily)
MKDTKVALFDMDGTLCDYVGSLKKELEKLRSPNEPIVDPFKVGNDPKFQYLWDRVELIKADENWWANLPKLSLGYEVLEMTKELGYYNEILTQAPRTNPAALAGKLRWILTNIDDSIDFTMTRNKGRHYGRVLVDDYPDYALTWLAHRKNGLVIMPSNEYNIEFKHAQVIMYDGHNKEQVRDGLVDAMNR